MNKLERNYVTQGEILQSKVDTVQPRFSERDKLAGLVDAGQLQRNVLNKCEHYLHIIKVHNGIKHGAIFYEIVLFLTVEESLWQKYK